MKTCIRLWIPTTMLALSSVFLVTNCTKDVESTKDATIPVLTTSEVSAITKTTATSGGSISSDGGATVTARGVCWSTSQTPTVSDSKTSDGTGAGNFTSDIADLTANTTYYVRAYATNSAGTGYGSAMSFKTEESATDHDITEGTMKDGEGNTYKTVTIGTQTWMAENLKVTKYNDNTDIPNVTDGAEWSNLATGAYCNYDNEQSNVATYGRLYNWYAVNTGKLCPTGWHVPSDAEWTTLENYLIVNGYNFDGTTIGDKIAKSLASKTGWEIYDEAGTIGAYPESNNSTGFTALPGGYRYFDGYFDGIWDYGRWWSSTENDSDFAYFRYLRYKNGNLTKIGSYKKFGFSVRCVRD